MKKILIPLFILLVSGVLLIIGLGCNKVTDTEFYTLPENYSFVYEKGRRMTFNVYSKTSGPLIAYPESNSYQLKMDSQSFYLENVEIKEEEFNDYSLIKIESDLPYLTDSEYISQHFYMIITNGAYTIRLDMGSFSVLNGEYYKLLGLDALSGTYSKVDGTYELVGINLTLTEKRSFMESMRIGGLVYGTLSKAKENLTLDSEVVIDDYLLNYSTKKVEETYTLGLSSKTLFIPLGYIQEYMVRGGYIVVRLDGEYYYFDAFSFMTSDPLYAVYESKMVKGEYLNA